MSGARGKSGRGPAQGEEGGGELKRDAWTASASRRWPGAGLSGGRAAYGTGGGKQRSWQEEAKKDWFANLENFRDPDVNQR